MTGLLLLGAAAAYALSAWIYFHGRFGLAALCGAVYWALMAPAAVQYLGSGARSLRIARGRAGHRGTRRTREGPLPAADDLLDPPLRGGLLLWVVVAAGAILR
jgi:hypothetical protein